MIEQLRSKLQARGTKGFIGIQRLFRIMDDDNDKAISYKEFAKALRDFKIDLQDQEARALFAYFDVDRSGKLEINEFVQALTVKPKHSFYRSVTLIIWFRQQKGELSEGRASIVRETFRALDKDNDGVIRVNDIKGIYSARQHPDVKSGKKTEDDVLGEFLETFEIHHHLSVGTRDQQVTLKEFIEYYTNVSASIDSDEYFERMIATSFKLWTTNTKYREYAPEKTQIISTVQPNRLQVHSLAPFGTSTLPTDYSTNLRPNTSQGYSY